MMKIGAFSEVYKLKIHEQLYISSKKLDGVDECAAIVL